MACLKVLRGMSMDIRPYRLVTRARRGTKCWDADPGPRFLHFKASWVPDQRRSATHSMLALHRIRDTRGWAFLNELHRNAAERAEVAMQRIALLGKHHTGERT